MEIKYMKEKLLDKGYKINIFKGEIGSVLFESSIEIFIKGSRVIVVKEYINEYHFNNWVEVDKITLAAILGELSIKQKNNLYFIICLNYNYEIKSELLENINQIEKDDKICRKYVIVNQSDIERIPFLSDSNIDSPKRFDYEESFKEKLKLIDGIVEESTQIAIDYFNNEYGELGGDNCEN